MHENYFAVSKLAFLYTISASELSYFSCRLKYSNGTCLFSIYTILVNPVSGAKTTWFIALPSHGGSR